MRTVNTRQPLSLIYYWFAGLLLVAATLNCFTPLRLNTDSIRYFNIMLYLQGNLPADDYAGRDFFPHGYPTLLLYLAAAGALSSKVIVLINVAAIICAGYFICRIYQVKHWLVVGALMLLSFINIKHFTIALADELFCGVFILAIYCWTLGLKNKPIFILPAMLLTAASVYLRTAGLVIITGLAMYAVVANYWWVRKKAYRIALVALGAVLPIIVFVIKLPVLELKNDYFRQLAIESVFKHPLFLFERLGIHLKEIGEFILNLPSSKLTAVSHINSATTDLILIAVGLAALALMLCLFVKWKMYRRLAGCIYLCYLLMLFVWPFYDGRFLIPAIPFFIYTLYRLFLTKKYFALKALAFVYVIMGIASLSYSTAMSLNHNIFLKYYGTDPELSKSYKEHFEKKHPQPNIQQQRTLYLLNKFDK